jgi:hypothetical protein
MNDTQWKDIANRLTAVQEGLDDRSDKTLGISSLIALSVKLDGKTDDTVSTMFEELLRHLKAYPWTTRQERRNYTKQRRDLERHVKTTYGYVPSGSVRGEYMALGIAFGLMIGTALVAINPTFLAIGLPIGLAVGLSLGAKKEEQLEQEDRLY